MKTKAVRALRRDAMPGLIDGLPEGTFHLIAGYSALLVVPGPSMVVVSAASLAARGREGLTAAFGVAVGTAVLVFATIYAWGKLGEAANLGTIAPLLFAVTMLYLGQRLLVQAIRPCTLRAAGTGRAVGGHFLAGLVTALTNPISFAFFSTAAMSLPEASDGMLIAAPACIFVMALGWFSLVGRITGRIADRGVPPYVGSTVRATAGAVLLIIATWTLLDALTTGGLI